MNKIMRKMMKMITKKTAVMCAVMILATLSLQSCLDDDDDDNYIAPMYNALVTLKTNPTNGKLYIQLNDSTVINPDNMTQSPFGGKEVRALANISFEDVQPGHSILTARVNRLDSIRTKDMAADKASENDSIYGTAPLEIYNDWMTVAEDGYLTLHFRMNFSGRRVHSLNLIKGSKPGEVILYHNDNGDGQGGRPANGLIAFKLNKTLLQESNGTLTLKWKSFSGDKSAKFKIKVQ